MNGTNPERPDVVRSDGQHLHIANVLYLWESGDFSDWAEGNFPLEIDGTEFASWDGVEDALVDFPRGPYDPRELDD
jgi:hypothetical protein